MRQIVVILLTVVFCLFTQISFSAQQQKDVPAVQVQRNILAVIDGDEGYNSIESYAETVLNHLGFNVEYVDVTKRLPSDDEVDGFAGIMSWFTDNKLKGAVDYAQWITKQLTRGKKLLVINNLGFALSEKNILTPKEINDKFFKAFQMSFDPTESLESPLLTETVINDPKMTEFERSLKGELTLFEKISVTDKSAKIYLKLKRKDTGSTCDAIFIHSKGGYVLGNYALFLNLETKETRWRINPFEFFRRVFDTDFPKPDITTINGMRLFMSHIDGDGIRNVSSSDQKTISGDIAYDRFFMRYKLPISVSALVGDLVVTKQTEGGPLFDTFKKIFALPNIEPASHGWAHPFIWEKQKRKMAYNIPGYVYSPANEIGASLKFINEKLVPKEKQTKLFFWTGDCKPDAEALQYVYENEILNFNGGDTRFDNQYPSYTYVMPFHRHVDGWLQNFAVDSNEVPYTNMWTGPFYGYRFAIETFKRTESPIRIRPIDVYYHFYNMEHDMSVKVLKDIYDWTLSQEIAPVFVSEYIAKLDGFRKASVERISQNSFIITDNGALRTFRIDNSDSSVDMNRSTGVVGFMHYQGSLYIYLDNGERSQIFLTSEKQTVPYLQKANGEVRLWKKSEAETSFWLKVIGRLQFQIAGLVPNGKYIISVMGRDNSLSSDEKGVLKFVNELGKSSFEWIEVKIKASS